MMSAIRFRSTEAALASEHYRRHERAVANEELVAAIGKSRELAITGVSAIQRPSPFRIVRR